MTTCRLRSVRSVVAGVVPAGWPVGVFGSTAVCLGRPCSALNSDVDLVVVHPPGAERDAIAVRRHLVDVAIQGGWVADVTIMSASEIVSTEFWPGESVKDLDVAGAGCAASGAEHSPSPGAGPSRTSSCGGRGPRGP